MGQISRDHVARREFRNFIEIGNAIRLPEDARRAALRLSEREWADWTRLLADGPLPNQPILPDMLQRLGTASYSLAMVADRQGFPPDAGGASAAIAAQRNA
jgi:hypothetical protein